MQRAEPLLAKLPTPEAQLAERHGARRRSLHALIGYVQRITRITRMSGRQLIGYAAAYRSSTRPALRAKSGSEMKIHD